MQNISKYALLTITLTTVLVNQLLGMKEYVKAIQTQDLALNLFPTNATNSTINWCILDENNTFAFVHVPHATEALLQCWSWFQTLTNRTEECGFYFPGTVSMKGKSQLMSEWKNLLVHAMGCHVTYDIPPTGHPSYYLNKKTGKQMWLWTRADMHGLQEKFADSGIFNQRRPSDPLRIGFVDRAGNRRILNMKKILDDTQQRYPEAAIDMVFMEKLTAKQQMEWWSRQDVVVAAHGAALTNMIFLRNNSAIVEIFPDHYCPIAYFGELCYVAGVRNYGYYGNCTTTKAQHEDRARLRSLNLEPSVDLIMNLLSNAVTGLHFNLTKT